MSATDPATRKQQIESIRRTLTYRPLLIAGVISLSLATAILEGFGLGFIIPVVQFAQPSGATNSSGAMMDFFVRFYQLLGLPLTLETVIIGVAMVLTVRYITSFVVEWLQAVLRTSYVRHVQSEAFEGALNASTRFYDTEGSDDILNAIITQAKYSGHVMQYLLRLVHQGLLCVVYTGLAIYVAPRLTIIVAIFLGGITYLLRNSVEAGYNVGSAVADANERVQAVVQAGVQGNRDTKVFTLTEELYEEFTEAISSFESARIQLKRNQAALNNSYQLITAVTIFALIYAALEVAQLRLSEVGLFLFAMFRLSPRVSTLNNIFYRLEGELPHLVRTHEFTDELEVHEEPAGGERPVPDEIRTIEFDGVSFAYEEETVLQGVSFSLERDEFVGIVGESGAGKSTIAALLLRLYEPDDGIIRANGEPIQEFNVTEWRERISVVHQHPFVFDETLRYNLTIGNREATDKELERVCELARIDEFMHELDNGFDTELGDDGVRLSGGQRQRVALARALLMETDVLVLDEATSELDSTLEAEIHGSLEELDTEQAMFVIAHNLSTVENADRILVLRNGELVEAGSHDDLLAKGGQYADLYTAR